MVINNLFHSKRTYAPKRKIDYIVIHYTAGTTSKKGAAYNTAMYFKTSNVDGSADYIVDDETVYCCNSDIRNYYSWAVGGSKYTSMTTKEGGSYYGKCTNKNSISIEICSNKTNAKTLYASDTDWYFTDKEIWLAAELIQKLMAEYGVPIENIIMHHHITGKICPNPFCVNEDRLRKWYEFKTLIIGDDEMAENITIKVNGKEYKAKRILKDGENFVRLRDLRKAGFVIGYDEKSKVPSIANEYKELEITVDGKKSNVETINIGGSNFIPIRSMAEATGSFNVGFENGKVVVRTVSKNV